MIKRIILKLLLTLAMLFTASNLYAKGTASNYIEVVQKSKVCMVNNFYNPMADFSEFKVEIKKRSYYGCCAMCKDKLTKSTKFRMAIDPLTGAHVDKADAYIVADKTNKGRTLYFVNKANFLKYVSK